MELWRGTDRFDEPYRPGLRPADRRSELYARVDYDLAVFHGQARY